MPRWITVWVETPMLPAEAVELWARLPDYVERDDIDVRAWSDGPAGHATLRVRADSEAAAAVAVRAALESAFGPTILEGLDARTQPDAEDPIVFDDDDEPMPLAWIRSACEWTEYAVSDDERLIQVHYTQAGTARGPGAAIAEVVVSEAGATVAISLFEREIVGTYPDGAEAGRALAAVSGCLTVRLHRPLSQRRVIDGSTGIVARRLDPTSDRDRRRLAWAAERGCPIWEP